MADATEIKADQPRRETNPEKLPAAMAALHELRAAIQGVVPRLVAHRHVHGLLHGLDVDLGKSDGLDGETVADLLDRIGLLLEAADEGEVLPVGELSPEKVERLVLAARQATIRLRAYQGVVA